MKIFGFSFASETLAIGYYKGEATIRTHYPFFLPHTDEPYVAYPALVLRIGRTGREVLTPFAARYINAIGVGFDIQRPQLLGKLQHSGLPWDEAVAFEYASGATLGTTILKESLQAAPLAPSYTLTYGREGDDTTSWAQCNISHREIAQAVEYLSRLNIIHVGDLLFLHPEEAHPLSLSLEQNYTVLSPDVASYTLRVK